MTVSVYPFRDDMIMLVRMRDRVAVRASIMGVNKGMLMNMSMVSDHGVNHDKHGPRKHDSKRKQIHSGQLLMQDEERQKSTYKRSDSIVGACFRRAENTLRPDIQENAQSVCHIAKDQRKRNIPKSRHLLSLEQSDRQRTESAAESFYNDDLERAFG